MKREKAEMHNTGFYSATKPADGQLRPRLCPHLNLTARWSPLWISLFHPVVLAGQLCRFAAIRSERASEEEEWR